MSLKSHTVNVLYTNTQNISILKKIKLITPSFINLFEQIFIIETLHNNSYARYKQHSPYRRTLPFNINISLVAQRVKNLPAIQKTWVGSLSWEDSLAKEMATHSSILVWRIPWTEESGPQSIGSVQQRVGHDLATNTNKCFMIAGNNGDVFSVIFFDC